MRTQKEIDADPGKGMSSDQLDDHFNPDGGGEHPYFTRADWVVEVRSCNTISGYWDWLEYTLDQEDASDESGEDISGYTK